MKKYPIDIKADGDAVTIKLTGAAARRFRAVADWRGNGLLGALQDLAPVFFDLAYGCGGDEERYDTALRIARTATAGVAKIADDGGAAIASELTAYIFAADKTGAA